MWLRARICFIEEENVSLYPIRSHVGTVHDYIPQSDAFDPFEVFVREHTEYIIKIIIMTVIIIEFVKRFYISLAPGTIMYYVHSLVFIIFKPESIGLSDPNELIHNDGRK
jgi:hypothetical protein